MALEDRAVVRRREDCRAADRMADVEAVPDSCVGDHPLSALCIGAIDAACAVRSQALRHRRLRQSLTKLSITILFSSSLARSSSLSLLSYSSLIAALRRRSSSSCALSSATSRSARERLASICARFSASYCRIVASVDSMSWSWIRLKAVAEGEEGQEQRNGG